MLHIEKYGVEIEMECQCVHSYKFHAAQQRNLLRTAIFYMQINKNIQKCIVNLTSWQFTI